MITTGFTKYGGLASVVMNCLRQMDISEFKICIVSGNVPENDLLDECKERGIEYIRISGRNRNPIKYMYRLMNISHSYDVIHIHSNSATAAIELIAAKLAGIKIRIVHNHTAKCEHQIASFFLKPVFSKLYTHGIACSQKAGDWIFNNKNYQILNNSIDTEIYRFNCESRKRIRQQYEIDNNCICIGHVGKIYQPKNHKFLIDIFKDYHSFVKNSKLLLVGDGIMREDIELYVEELSISDSVIFAGMKPNVNEYLSAFDIFVFPSLWEGMPLSVLEAQASGLPCIISNAIDTDVIATNIVTMLPLDEGTKAWVERLPEKIEYNREKKSDESILQLRANNYDSRVSANILRKLYS